MSDLVTDREPCSEKERQELLAYLRAKSHVRLPIDLLEAGWPLEKGKVKGIATIGQVQTCFETLGDTKSRALHGTQHFLVAQALAVFKDPGEDAHANILDSLGKIQCYKEKFAGADSDPIVTMVELPDWTGIADGDKTAIAGLLYAEETGKSDFMLPVYYISPPRAVPTPLAAAGTSPPVAPPPPPAP